MSTQDVPSSPIPITGSERSVRRDGDRDDEASSVHGTSPLSKMTCPGCYHPGSLFTETGMQPESPSLSGRVLSLPDESPDVRIVFMETLQSVSQPKPSRSLGGDPPGVDVRRLLEIKRMSLNSLEKKVGEFFDEIAIDDHYLTQFLGTFPKGGDTHCHLTGSIDANTYLRYAVQLDLVCDPETFIFRRKDEASSAEPAISAADIMTNYPLQTRYYQKATTRGQSVETGLTCHKFFETFPVFESIEKYLKLSQLIAPLIKDAFEQKIFYLEVSKGFEFDLDILDEQPCSASVSSLDPSQLFSSVTMRSLTSSSLGKSPSVEETQFALESDSSSKTIPTLKESYLKDFPSFLRFENKHLPIRGEDEELKQLLDNKLDILLPYVQKLVEQYIAYIDEGDHVVLAELQKHGFKEPLFSVRNPTVIKLNVDVNRELPLSGFFADLAVAFLLAHRESQRDNPRVVGIVVSGREHHENALTNRDAQLKMIRYFQDRFLKVRISLHAGELTETLVPKKEMRAAIRKAIKFAKPSRLGHAVSLKEDKDMFGLLQMLKAKKICIETCLTSNEKTLQIVNGSHPFKKYLNDGIAVTLNTDDAGVNGSSLTNEFKIAAKRYKLTYEQMKKLARNQIRYSFLKGDEIFQEDGYDLKEMFWPLLQCQKGALSLEAIQLESEARRLLEASPKASLQYALEIAFLKFEETILKEMLPNVVRLEEQ